MAYSTVNPTAVSVTNFGAKGDGVNNDTSAIQRAIDSLYPKGGGDVLLPKGTYLTSGYIHITGHNISLYGEPGNTLITTAPSGDFRKINVSGASGFGIYDINIDAGRVSSGRSLQYVGTVNVYSAPYFTMNRCSVVHSEGLSVHFRGNTYNATVQNSRFSDFHVALYSDSNDISGIAPKYLYIDNNDFSQSWGTYPEDNYFGGIKFQNVGFEVNHSVPARSCGHRITNNVFSGTNQMGVELWGYISDSVVSNNYIENSHFGISIAASSHGIVVDSNTMKANTYVGIEIADSADCIVSNNSINGSTGKHYMAPVVVCQEGIIINGSQHKTAKATVVGNSVSNCAKNLHVFNVTDVNVVGNTFFQSGIGMGQSIYISNGHLVNISNNAIHTETGAHFVFFNSDSVRGISGVTISSNDFIGNVSDWGIISYAPVGPQTNLLIQDNRTYAVRYCGYGMIDIGAATSATVRDNLGQTGNLGYYIPDQSIPAGSSPYQTSAIQDGYQFYSTSLITIPGSGVPYSSGAWVNIGSGDCNGNVRNVRYTVKSSIDTPPYTYDNRNENLEIYASIAPYNLDSLSIMVSPQASYNGNIVKEVWVDNPGGDVLGTVWINLRSGSVATSGYKLTVYGSDNWLISNPVVQYARPAFGALAVGIDLDLYAKSLIKTTRGVQIADSAIYAPASGRLTITSTGTAFTGRVGINTTDPAYTLHVNGSFGLSSIGTEMSANAGPASALPANPAGYVTINITGGNFKIPYYNI